MPPISVNVDVDVDLADICNISDLKKVVAYGLGAGDTKVQKAAENLIFLAACDRAVRLYHIKEEQLFDKYIKPKLEAGHRVKLPSWARKL